LRFYGKLGRARPVPQAYYESEKLFFGGALPTSFTLLDEETMDNHEALLKAFRIKPEDIEANRAGRLGPTQAHNLLVSGNFNLAGAFLVGLVLAAILYWLANKPLVPIQWILSLILFAITLFFGVRYFRQTREAVADGRVECLIGQVHVGSHGRAGWYLAVAGQSFQLPVQPWYIQQDAEYRVYVATRSHNVVAMELATHEHQLIT
jgi:hypothetical protein